MSSSVNPEVHVEPPYTRLVAALPATVPFVGPEAIERRTGQPFQLRLGANESLFGPSPRAAQAMRAAVDSVAQYGDPENADLRSELARIHGVAATNVVVASGIDDMLGLAVRAWLDPGIAAVTSLGAYPTFNYHVAGFGGHLERVPYHGDRNDLDALAAAAHRTRARLVYLANPDNPSGTWHTASDVLAFVERLPRDCVLLLDEAYIEFAPADTAPVDADYPQVLRLRTFSKAHGMAGARIGYALGTATMIAAFEKIRLHFGVNRIAQIGALASLGDADHVRSVVDAVAEGRRDYERLAHSLGLATLPSATNFVAIDVGAATAARALLAELEAHGVFVRMPSAPPLDRCIRVTMAPPEQRAAFASILQQICTAGRYGAARPE